MLIVMVSQWFDPEPTNKGMVFARALTSAGRQVVVLTGFPNYPSGRIYPGYRQRLVQTETLDGIRVVRVPLYPSHDSSSLKRFLNYASFALSASLVGVWRTGDPDLVYAYHPPLTTGFAALWLGWVKRVPVVYDIQDLWPDTLRATGMLRSRWALRTVGRLCGFVYQRVSRIVVLSPGMKTALESKGVAAGKIEVIYNWCDRRGCYQLSQSVTLVATLELLHSRWCSRERWVALRIWRTCSMPLRSCRRRKRKLPCHSSGTG